ncbi:MAG: amidohydrolase family protein [Bacteroidales bacterium]|nr:amidohydrolase family protein [Bacteroidales bacterium]
MDENLSKVISDVGIFTEGQLIHGNLVIADDGRIAEIQETPGKGEPARWLLPGVIDTHVHFREPGLTQKADIESESRAAAAGGVTYVLDMPNVKPTTTTPEALTEKHSLYQQKCLVNYGLWYGITSSNIDEALALYGLPDSPHRDEICGFKVFLGSSTGGMLMNDQQKLRQLFAGTQRLIGVHSESEDIIRRNADKYREMFAGQEVPVEYHPLIRSTEACLATTRMAINLAKETGAQLHVCHITTAEELELMGASNITGEVCVAHLWFSEEDYERLDTRIKCNPAVKRVEDREALRRGLTDGRIFSVATDHAPHLLSDKQGGALRAASGMPSIQYSLLAMLELCRQDVLPLSKVIELMCQHPAQRFGLAGRGEIRVGNFADLVLVDPTATTTVSKENILSKCGWSPFEGTTFSHRICGTWVNGRQVY